MFVEAFGRENLIQVKDRLCTNYGTNKGLYSISFGIFPIHDNSNGETFPKRLFDVEIDLKSGEANIIYKADNLEIY